MREEHDWVVIHWKSATEVCVYGATSVNLVRFPYLVALPSCQIDSIEHEGIRYAATKAAVSRGIRWVSLGKEEENVR